MGSAKPLLHRALKGILVVCPEADFTVLQCALTFNCFSVPEAGTRHRRAAIGCACQGHAARKVNPALTVSLGWQSSCKHQAQQGMDGSSPFLSKAPKPKSSPQWKGPDVLQRQQGGYCKENLLSSSRQKTSKLPLRMNRLLVHLEKQTRLDFKALCSEVLPERTSQAMEKDGMLAVGIFHL